MLLLFKTSSVNEKCRKKLFSLLYYIYISNHWEKKKEWLACARGGGQSDFVCQLIMYTVEHLRVSSEREKWTTEKIVLCRRSIYRKEYCKSANSPIIDTWIAYLITYMRTPRLFFQDKHIFSSFFWLMWLRDWLTDAYTYSLFNTMKREKAARDSC